MLLLCFDNPLQLQVTSPSRFALLCFFVVVLRQITVEQPKTRTHTRAHLVVCFVSVNWRGCRCAGGGPRGPGPVDQREESLIQGTLDWYRGITGIFQRFLRDESAGFFFCCCSRENEENVPLVRPLEKKKKKRTEKRKTVQTSAERKEMWEELEEAPPKCGHHAAGWNVTVSGSEGWKRRATSTELSITLPHFPFHFKPLDVYSLDQIRSCRSNKCPFFFPPTHTSNICGHRRHDAFVGVIQIAWPQTLWTK